MDLAMWVRTSSSLGRSGTYGTSRAVATIPKVANWGVRDYKPQVEEVTRQTASSHAALKAIQKKCIRRQVEVSQEVARNGTERRSVSQSITWGQGGLGHDWKEARGAGCLRRKDERHKLYRRTDNHLRKRRCWLQRHRWERTLDSNGRWLRTITVTMRIDDTTSQRSKELDSSWDKV